VIKNGSYREVLGGIGQAQMVGFCSGKLLLQPVSDLPSNNHNRTNILVYQWEPEQMPGPWAKDQKKWSRM